MDDVLNTVRSVISTTATRWQKLIDTLPETLLTRAPAPGEWSAIDCLGHLLTVEQLLFSVRLRHLLEGREQLIEFDFDAPREPGPVQTPRELVAAFVAQRQESEAILAGLTPPDLERKSYHPEYGDVTLGYLLNLWAAHDLQHTMQAFIPNTGVFRFEFADHDVEAMRT